MPNELLTQEKAAYWATSLSSLECRVICLLAHRVWNYRQLAEETGGTYAELSRVGRHLQYLKFAWMRTAYLMSEFNGRALCLSPRGEQVRLAIEALERRRRKRKTD